MQAFIDQYLANRYQPILLEPNSKRPAFRSWQERLMGRGELLWWIGKRRFNLGLLLGSSVIVVDRDSRDMATWRYIQKNKLRSPMETETCSGNWHVFMRPDDSITEFRSRIRFLGMPIDILSGERYVVVPPSVVDGRPYVFRPGKGLTNVAELPVFPGELLIQPQDKPRAGIVTGFRDNCNLDCKQRAPVARSVRNAERYVLAVESHQGSNGSAGLIRAIAVLRDNGKSPQEVFDYLLHVWNKPPRVMPPWSAEEIMRAVVRHCK